MPFVEVDMENCPVCGARLERSAKVEQVSTVKVAIPTVDGDFAFIRLSKIEGAVEFARKVGGILIV